MRLVRGAYASALSPMMEDNMKRTMYELSQAAQDRIAEALAKAMAVDGRKRPVYEQILYELSREGSAHPERHAVHLCLAWLREEDPMSFKLSVVADVMDYLGHEVASLRRFRETVRDVIRGALSESALRFNG